MIREEREPRLSVRNCTDQEDMAGLNERSPLLGPPPGPRRSNRIETGDIQTIIPVERQRVSWICGALFGLGCIGLVGAVVLCHRQYEASTVRTRNTLLSAKPFLLSQDWRDTSTNSFPLSILSLMVWGSPGSFGTEDKELRMQAIGNLTHSSDWDLLLLSDLWMRPDHQAVRDLLPEGHDMTSVDDLSVSSCDGSIAPEFCSGLAVVSKTPIIAVEFTSFDVHGDLLWDYEYFLRRGVGRVRIEPKPDVTVDVFITSLASNDYNYWYRERQAAQLVKLVSQSTAQYVIVGGDFNVDPRDGEDTYNTVKKELKDSVEEFYKGDQTKYLDPSRSTLGNPQNSYTSKGEHPVLYDYIWYTAAQGRTITVTQFQVPILKTSGAKTVSLSSHEAVVAGLSLG